MQNYESVIILTTKISEEDATEQVKKITDLISSNGECISVDDWKTKKLAYEIKHEEEGHYLLFKFNAKPIFISEFERVLRINSAVLKHMVIKK